jgi:hypothetical protein
MLVFTTLLLELSMHRSERAADMHESLTRSDKPVGMVLEKFSTSDEDSATEMNERANETVIPVMTGVARFQRGKAERNSNSSRASSTESDAEREHQCSQVLFRI